MKCFSISVLVILLAVGCASTPEAEPQKAQFNSVIVACPVSGEKIGESRKADKSEYGGNTYYFCCAGCKEAFDANPEDYVGD